MLILTLMKVCGPAENALDFLNGGAMEKWAGHSTQTMGGGGGGDGSLGHFCPWGFLCGVGCVTGAVERRVINCCSRGSAIDFRH